MDPVCLWLGPRHLDVWREYRRLNLGERDSPFLEAVLGMGRQNDSRGYRRSRNGGPPSPLWTLSVGNATTVKCFLAEGNGTLPGGNGTIDAETGGTASATPSLHAYRSRSSTAVPVTAPVLPLQRADTVGTASLCSR